MAFSFGQGQPLGEGAVIGTRADFPKPSGPPPCPQPPPEVCPPNFSQEPYRVREILLPLGPGGSELRGECHPSPPPAKPAPELP